MDAAAIEWGTVGEWFGGVMTAGALAAAVFALRRESSAREALEARLERERRQEEERLARQVVVRHEVSTPQYKREGRHVWAVVVDVRVLNESDRSVLDVVVECTIAVPMHASMECPPDTDPPAILRPGRDWLATFRREFDSEEEQFPPPAGLDPYPWVTVSAAFTDVDGRRWRTVGPGLLERIDPV